MQSRGTMRAVRHPHPRRHSFFSVPRRHWIWLIPLAAYAFGFAQYPPRAFLVADESHYVAQAAVFAAGNRWGTVTDPLSGTAHSEPLSTYPVGTSLLQAPFVWLSGPFGAAWLSVFSLIITMAVLVVWLRAARLPEWPAVLFLAFAPTLVLGRLAMSDVPSAAAVTLGWWLIWKGGGTQRTLGFLAGLVGGASLLLRETNVLFFAPLFVGALVRRDRNWRPLVLGGALGLAIRLASSAWMFGNAFHVRPSGYGFSLAQLGATVPLYLFILMVLIPGGLAAAFTYRGVRRAELLATVAISFVFFACYSYSGEESGGARQVILAGRYFIPLAPILVFAIADALCHRLLRTWRTRPLVLRLAGALTCAATTIAAVSIHPRMDALGRISADIARQIYQATPQRAVLITNIGITRKYLSPAFGDRVIAPRDDVPTADVPRIVARGVPTYMVLADRSDSEFLRADSATNAAYRSALQLRCSLEPTVISRFTSQDHGRTVATNVRLAVWRVAACSDSVAS
jgi:hypothetical protein